MAVLPPPANVGLTLKIAPDGAPIPVGPDLGPAGSSGLGLGVVCVTGLDTSLPTGVVIQQIYANVGFPLPWARYTITWSAVVNATSSGVKAVCNTF